MKATFALQIHLWQTCVFCLNFAASATDEQNTSQKRMHSSRMRTACALPYKGGSLSGQSPPRTETPLDRDPLDQDPKTETPQTETSRTETPQIGWYLILSFL